MAATTMDSSASPPFDPRQTMDSLVSVTLTDSVRLSSVRLSIAPTLHEVETSPEVAHNDDDEVGRPVKGSLGMHSSDLNTVHGKSSRQA